jgi:putative membrane protein
MKRLLRNTIVNGTALALVVQLLPGVIVAGGLRTYVLSGLVLSLLNWIVKPILNILSLPFNMVTLGLFSFFSNAILLYLLTFFVTEIRITSFTFQGYTFAGFIAPAIHFNSFFAYIVAAALLSLFINFFHWINKK